MIKTAEEIGAGKLHGLFGDFFGGGIGGQIAKQEASVLRP